MTCRRALIPHPNRDATTDNLSGSRAVASHMSAGCPRCRCEEDETMSNVVKTGGSDPNNATSSTTFGRSVESQAQMKDAQKKGASTAGELLNVYRLVPIAEPDDPNWQNAPSHGEIVVAARTAGDARIV